MKEYKVKVNLDRTEWFNLEGDLHRDDGPAREFTNGYKEWWKEGKLHRDDGPACECADGTKHWYKEGKRHRDDGPAVERANGAKYWWKDGKKLTEEEFLRSKDPCEGKVVEIDGKKYKLSRYNDSASN